MLFLRLVALLPLSALLCWTACAPAALTAPPPAPAEEPPPKDLDIDDPAREPDVVFWPTPPSVVDKMLEVAEVKSTDVVYDLGSGDGRIVIAAAKRFGARGIGFEIDAKLVAESKRLAKEAGVDHLVTFERKDIFTLDLTPATVVTLYILPNMIKRLIPQMNKLRPGSRIVSHNYAMPGVEPEKTFTAHLPEAEHLVLLWRPPLRVSAIKAP